ncbi:hypothetical protein DFH06DRAFT_1251695 [Mycena polygramma]|nr:hypothetical protein DFH06DRAFT_1251695 [Mycena polygramma]
MATHPWPHALPRKDILISPHFLLSSFLPHVMLPAVAAAPPLDADPIERRMHLVFHVFYLEWDCFMGPDPAAPLPSATPLVPNHEALAFFMLFPYGTGHYLGPEQQRGLTFEQYALHRLNLADERFRHSAEWLTWVLTRTADAELAKAVNCVLVTLHKQKARHLGGGEVQTLSLDVPFGRIPVGGGSKRSER